MIAGEILISVLLIFVGCLGIYTVTVLQDLRDIISVLSEPFLFDHLEQPLLYSKTQKRAKQVLKAKPKKGKK